MVVLCQNFRRDKFLIMSEMLEGGEYTEMADIPKSSPPSCDPCPLPLSVAVFVVATSQWSMMVWKQNKKSSQVDHDHDNSLSAFLFGHVRLQCGGELIRKNYFFPGMPSDKLILSKF